MAKKKGTDNQVFFSSFYEIICSSLTIEDICNCTGVTRQSVYDWSNGICQMSMENICAIAEILNKDPWDLLENTIKIHQDKMIRHSIY